MVWAVGDGADGGTSARTVARSIARERVDRLLYLGDVYEHGTAEEFASNYATTFGRLDGRTAPTLGNHDSEEAPEGYYPYWTNVYGRRAASFYSFRLGGWQLLSLNSEIDHDPGSAQLDWLEARLSAPGTCRLAFWHRPRYSAGTIHGDQPDVAPFWRVLRGHATLVVNGHEHDMQRFEPRDGMTELVSGAGGHDHYPLDRSRSGLAYGDDADYGALRLRLRPGMARFSFVADDGCTLDSGRVPCDP